MKNLLESASTSAAPVTWISELTSGIGFMVLYTNSVNHGRDPIAFLQQLPLERVVQLHFVGGHWNEDVLVDSHSQATPPEVWTLMEEVMKRAAVKGVVLERDENLPPFEEMLEELEQVRRIGRSHGQWA